MQSRNWRFTRTTVNAAMVPRQGSWMKTQLFYLRARGIEEAEARDLLVAAFLEDSLEVISEEAPRDAFCNVISNWLAARRAKGNS